MTQKELTCRGLEGWRHGVQRHVGRTKYYRTTPANSSPKFRWLNGKAPQGQHDGRTDVHFQKMRLHPPHPGLNWAITDKRLSYIPNRWSLSSQTLAPETASRQLTDAGSLGWRFLPRTCTTLPGTHRGAT